MNVAEHLELVATDAQQSSGPEHPLLLRGKGKSVDNDRAVCFFRKFCLLVLQLETNFSIVRKAGSGHLGGEVGPRLLELDEEVVKLARQRAFLAAVSRVEGESLSQSQPV